MSLSLLYCSVFLIDHAWTYEAEFARAQLRTIPGLARRMASLMDLIKDNSEQIVNGHCNEEKPACPQESPKISSAESFYTNDDGTLLV